MANKFFSFLLALSFTLSAYSQSTSSKYRIQFTDKNNSPFIIQNPEAFLSQRAIERRERQNITIKTNDLPVNPQYLDSLKVKGASILHSSRWFNATTIFLSDTTILDDIMLLPFVSSAKPVAKKTKTISHDKFETVVAKNSNSVLFNLPQTDYGYAFNQIDMIGGVPVHEQGFKGEGMLIAVLDAGFLNVQNLSVFEKLRNENRILITKDFVAGGDSVYGHNTHGTHVLSTMASFEPEKIVGTAPFASYILLRTEDGGSELIIEEDNWVAGAEFADSAGADIINSSLGYTTFDISSQNHTYQDMDGNSTLISIGADIAASKGILVINSAGNSGGDTWKYISAPADGDSVLAIGAVDDMEEYAAFSSQGPSYDGEVKPNVCAKGQDAAIASAYDGQVTLANGTSFSSPILAGMAACLWQAHPSLSNMEIFHAIEKSAHLYTNPNPLLGYGIPNFAIAHLKLSQQEIDDYEKDQLLKVAPNPFTDFIEVVFYSSAEGDALLQLTDLNGKVLYTNRSDTRENGLYQTTISPLRSLAQGIYILTIQTSHDIFYQKVMKK